MNAEQQQANADDETEKKKLGRPRSLTAELEKPILDGISGGLSVKEACAQAGVSYQSFQRRWADDEAFRNRSARAYLHGTIFYLNNAEARLESATPKTIAVAREIAHHARWRASRLIPAFSEKLAVGVTDESGFFGDGTQQRVKSTAPRDTWSTKRCEQWNAEERIAALQGLNFLFRSIGRDLSRLGFPSKFDEALAAFSAAMCEYIAHGEARPAGALPAPTDMKAVR